MQNRFIKKHTHKNGLFQDIFLPIVLFFAIFAVFVYGVNSISQTNNEKQLENIRQAVSRTAVHCYATEGFFPDSVSYLEQNYGLTIDHAKYRVDYEIFASNLMPNISVTEK